MQPTESIRLRTVYLEQLKVWLSNAEGPELIKQQEASKEDSLLGMAVSFDPVCYYPTPGVDTVVGMGLVFEPAYVPTVSFSSLLMTLSDWSNDPKERLSKACMTFLNVSLESEVFLLCRDYSILLDLTSKELVSSHFQRSHMTNFRAFKIPLVRGVSPRTKEWACYINILCLMGSTLCVSVASPDKDHWSIYKDKKFIRLLQHLVDEHQKRQEKAEAEKMEEEGNQQKEEQEDAPTNTDLPGMEVNDGEEALNPEEVPPHSNSAGKPLESMLREMDLGAKDGDIIFPISNIGSPPAYNHELSVEDREKAEVAISKICSIHLQAIYNAGGVRQVDQILAELLMALFTRVNLMMGEDLNTSLQELFSVVEESGKTLLTELKTAMGPTVSNLVPYNLQRVMESHNSHLYMSLTKVLVFLDCVRWEGSDFLEDQVKSLQSDEEFKKLITSLSEWILAFEDRVWEFNLSEELAEEEVALCVNLALTAT